MDHLQHPQIRRLGGNFVIFWFWIFGLGGCYLWHLVGFVLRLGVRQENCYLGTFYNLWAHSHWRSRSKVSGAERAWDSCDRDEILRTQQQPSSQNIPCKYFIQTLENWNIGSVRDASVSVYLCNSYQLSEDHHHGISAPGPRLASHVSSSHQLRGGMWLIVDTYQVSSLYLRGADLCLNKHPSSRKYYPSRSVHITSQLQTKNLETFLSDIWLSWLIFAAIILTEFPFCTNYVRPQKLSVPWCRVPSGESQLEKCHI